MFNPVEGVSSLDAISFADVMVKAMSSPRTAGNPNAHAHRDGPRAGGSARDGALLRAKFSPNAAAQEHEEVESLSDILGRRKSADLYSRLDTMLGHQSLLLGVA